MLVPPRGAASIPRSQGDRAAGVLPRSTPEGRHAIVRADDARPRRAYLRAVPTTLLAAESTLDAIAAHRGRGPARPGAARAGHRADRRASCPRDGYFLAADRPGDDALPSAPASCSDLPPDQCQPTWDYEFLVPDFLKFADIARSGRPVADMHDATGGRPERSPRWRRVQRGHRLHAPRCAWPSPLGGAAWGIGQLNRTGRAPRFSAEEQAWLERAARSSPTGCAARCSPRPSARPADRGPGIVLLDRDRRASSPPRREAADWLGELDPAIRSPDPQDLPLPYHARAFAAARSAPRTADREPAVRTRMRTRTGVWLLMHGATLSDGPTSWRSSSSRPRRPTSRR